MKISLLFVLLTCIQFQNVCSQKHTISGFVTDQKTGERLTGVNIYESGSLKGTITNVYGFYSITLPEDSIKLVCSYVGYQAIEKSFYLNNDTIIDFNFSKAEEIEEVKVYGNKSSVDYTQMSLNKINPITIERLPVLLGEKDLIKTIQLLPGIQSGSEGSSNFYVRGGGPDQNLILLDGVPVYNVSHLFGFFSVFNTAAVQDVRIIKGGFPARYGGRLSSVLDIRLKEGNNKEFEGEGSIGLISSKLTLEGPIIKDKSSFLVSGRRTYVDILTQPFIQAANTGDDKVTAGYFFYDFNVKTNYLFSNNDRLFFSVYSGKDKAYSRFTYNYDFGNEIHKEKMQLWWGNITGALRWNHVFNNQLFSNTTITYTRYKFLVGDEGEYITPSYSDKFNIHYFSGINDISGKIDFDYTPSPDHDIKFGTNFTHHVFHPGITAFFYEMNNESGIDTAFGNQDIYADEFYIYAEDDITLTHRLKMNAGIHYSGFNVRESFYHSLQPRVSLRYKLIDNMSLKASYTKMAQYIHLLTNSTIGLPTDLWLPVTRRIKPLKSNQYAIGAVYAFNNNAYEATLEGFYKDMNQLIEYKEGASFFSIENDWEDKLVSGKGWSYGCELLIKKKTGKTTGWIGYTLSWANRQFDEISFGRKFPASYDRRHDISLAINRKFSEKFDMGIVWVYGTGYPVTLALEKYPYAEENNINGYGFTPDFIEHIETRNNYRMPAYHRLDIGFNFHKEKSWFTRTWSIGVYNVYNRINPFFLYFEEAYDSNQNDKLKMIGLFPLIPFVNYSIKF